MNWYRKSMSLDPNAYSTEENPSRLGKDQPAQWTPYGVVHNKVNPETIYQNYQGVHFTDEDELAAVYACMKATIEDPPVLIEIYSNGMDKQLDVDAMVNRDLDFFIDNKRLEWQTIINSDMEDEEKSEKIMEDLDNAAMYGDTENEINDATDYIDYKTKGVAPSVILNMLQNKDAQQIVAYINGLVSRNIPKELLIAMVSQFRIMTPVGSSVVKAIYQIPLVDFSVDPNEVKGDMSDEDLEEQGWHRDGDEIKTEEDKVVVGFDSLENGWWLKKTPLYVNKQLRLPLNEEENTTWHGTSLSRARQAYPELLRNVDVPLEEKQEKQERNIPVFESMEAKNSNWYKEAKQTDHSYSWVFLDLPKDVADMIIEFGKQIEPEDLYTKEAYSGLELDAHVTIKYGLTADEAKEIKERLEDEKGGKFHLGESSIFEKEEYDVVKIEVESEDLERLHNRLNELPHEDKYPDYKAHATIAYVKKGKGKKYVGKFKINKNFKFKEVHFGDRKEKNTKIKLSRRNWYK